VPSQPWTNTTVTSLITSTPARPPEHERPQPVRLTVLEVDFAYGNNPVFCGFSAASDAPVVVLRGPSGCGKTTLLKLLAGFLLPQRARALTRVADPALVIQQDGLFPWMTGRGHLNLGKQVAWTVARAHALYPMVEPLLGKRCFRMSYGQRRKIELFGAFVRQHRALYLDEPFNFIDHQSRAEIIDFINSGGLSDRLVVLSSHYESDISGLDCDVIEFDGTLPVSTADRYAYSAGARVAAVAGLQGHE